MNISTRIRSVHPTSIALAHAVASLVTGCGDDPVLERTPSAVGVLANGFTPVEESPDDPGYCGYAEVGVDDFGTPVIEEERYIYPRINEILGANLDLQEITGLSFVSDCDGARKFMPAYNAYRGQNTEPAASKADLLANVRVFPPEGSKRPPYDANEMPKMMSQFDTWWPETVGWGWIASRGPNKGKSRFCTAIRLSGTLYLTAAHCMTTTSRGAEGGVMDDFSISYIKRQVLGSDNLRGEFYVTNRCPDLPPGDTCVALNTLGYMNPNYAGSGDYRNDIAVIYVQPDSQEYVRKAYDAANVFAAESVSWISTRTPLLWENVRIITGGPNGTTDDTRRPGDWVNKVSVELPINYVDVAIPGVENDVYTGLGLTMAADIDGRVCLGDSGGGAYDSYYHLTGLLSAFNNPDLLCAEVGDDQFFARVDWQVYSFIQQAMAELQQGVEMYPCECGFFPGEFDPTGVDPEYYGAHMRCNIGCEDPLPPFWTPPE